MDRPKKHRLPPALLKHAQSMRKESTAPERLLWSLLRNRQLGGMKFRRQQVIDSFVADFYCAEKQLIIEVDGVSHSGSEASDAARTAKLVSLGYRVIRVMNDDVLKNLEAVGLYILREAERGGESVGPPSPCPLPQGEGNLIVVRAECVEDIDAVRRVNSVAFERTGEAKLVDTLRSAASPIVSLVAERDHEVVGHILFTPVSIESDNNVKWQAMALGPMAVLPTLQRQGIGGRLVIEGLKRCAALNTPAVFVLGHPDYYPRFGFEQASKFGCRCVWDVPDEVFMVIKLSDAPLPGGLVRYLAVFETLA